MMNLGGKNFEKEIVVIKAKCWRADTELGTKKRKPKAGVLLILMGQKRIRGKFWTRGPTRAMSMLAWNYRGWGKQRII